MRGGGSSGMAIIPTCEIMKWLLQRCPLCDNLATGCIMQVATNKRWIVESGRIRICRVAVGKRAYKRETTVSIRSAKRAHRIRN